MISVAVLRALNRVYFSQSREHFYFTIWYGIADLMNRTLRYAGGGHPPAVLRAARCKTRRCRPAVHPSVVSRMPHTERSKWSLDLPTDVYLFRMACLKRVATR